MEHPLLGGAADGDGPDTGSGAKLVKVTILGLRLVAEIVSRMSASVRQHPLVAFFVLACALSWWPWVLLTLDLAPSPIVGFGPFLTALEV
jgi:hypothetical protein